MYKFKPYFKTTIWGGDKITKLKRTGSDMHNIGESWEISGVPGAETIISGGEYDGTPLNTLVAQLGASLLGSENYKRFGNVFPLLVKFIDVYRYRNFKGNCGWLYFLFFI